MSRQPRSHYSISQASAALGYSVSSLRRACNRGDVKYRRRPNGYRFWLASDILEIQAACQPSTQDDNR